MRKYPVTLTNPDVKRAYLVVRWWAAQNVNVVASLAPQEMLPQHYRVENLKLANCPIEHLRHALTCRRLTPR
jgi:hypothetical protein